MIDFVFSHFWTSFLFFVIVYLLISFGIGALFWYRR